MKRIALVALGLAALSGCSADAPSDAPARVSTSRAALNAEIAAVRAARHAHLRAAGVPVLASPADTAAFRAALKNGVAPSPSEVRRVMSPEEVEALNARQLQTLRDMKRIDPERYARLNARMVQLRGKTIEQLIPELQ